MSDFDYFGGDGYADDGYELDPDVLDAMSEAQAEAEDAARAAFDAKLAESEARWAEEDAALAAEEAEAQAIGDAEAEAVLRVSEAAARRGISDPRVVTDAWEAANGIGLGGTTKTNSPLFVDVGVRKPRPRLEPCVGASEARCG